MLKRSFYRSLNLSQIEGLHNVIKRAQAQSFNRALDCLHPAYHHDDRFGRMRNDTRNHLKTAHAAHRDVADNELELCLVKKCERVFSRSRRLAIVLKAQQVAQHLSDVRLVINNQDTHSLAACFWHIFSPNYFGIPLRPLNQTSARASKTKARKPKRGRAS